MRAMPESEGLTDAAPLDRDAARAAWLRSTDTAPDSARTGTLAFAFAQTGNPDDPTDEDMDALKQSVEIALSAEADRPHLYLERGLAYSDALRARRQFVPAQRLNVELIRYAGDNGLFGSSAFARALVQLADDHLRNGVEGKADEAASMALARYAALDIAADDPAYMEARLVAGLAKEAMGEHLQAALLYQSILDALSPDNPNHADMRKAVTARWLYTQFVVTDSTARTTEGAAKSGKAAPRDDRLGYHWPLDHMKEGPAKLSPLERRPPKMPRRAGQSGIVVLEYDVTDDGEPTDIEVLASWPAFYEEAATQALSEWTFPPKTEDEPDGYREGLRTSTRFILRDRDGRTLY
ncbi:MAG: TonB family protein [Pseudomonadota bacterium]